MPRHDLILPVIQNWSCHNCSGCCRQHQIEITEEERERIERQNWTAEDGIPPDQAVFQTLGPIWNRRTALAHQTDGACVFLNEEGLCRIHAKFGEAAKPLACRVYPYAFHPAGKQVAVSLRFSCPSVVKNLGKPLKENTGELKKIASQVVPDYAKDLAPPKINARERVSWADFGQFISALDETLNSPESLPVAQKLCRALGWLKLVETAKFEKVQGARLKEFLDLIREATNAELDATFEPRRAEPRERPGSESPGALRPSARLAREPTKAGRLHFRMLLAQYARKDTAAAVAAGWKGRWRLLKAYLRFAGGRGNLPSLQAVFQEVPFARVEACSRELPPEAEELFTRYFRVKIQGLHFCGRAFYDAPLVEGFRSLALMFPIVIWLARWLAVSDDRDSVNIDDLSQALAVADHHHGYSPALGTRTARSRVHQLSKMGDISRLCTWYGS